MNEIPKCPKCGSEYTYFDGSLYVCPDCSHEFDSVEDVAEVDDVARDSNGAELFDGDAVTVIKDLKVKGSSMVIKRGSKDIRKYSTKAWNCKCIIYLSLMRIKRM